jgi:hypothetical protein
VPSSNRSQDIQIKRLPQNIVQGEIKKSGVNKKRGITRTKFFPLFSASSKDRTFLWAAASDVGRGRIQFEKLEGVGVSCVWLRVAGIFSARESLEFSL